MAKEVYECEYCRTTFNNKQLCEEHELVCKPIQHIKSEGKHIISEAVDALSKLEKHRSFKSEEIYEHHEFIGYKITMVYK